MMRQRLLSKQFLKVDGKMKNKNKLDREGTNIEENNQRKRKKKSKKSLFRTIIGWLVFMIVGLSAIAIFLGLNHSYFDIETINIQGNFKNTDDQIIEELDFQKGDNIFKADLEKSENNLLNKPGIDQVEMNRIIPNTINIRLKEVLDIGYIRDGDNTYIIDKDGNVKYGDPEEFSRNELIEFKNVDTEHLEVGMNIAQDSNFADLINNLKLYDYFNQIDSMDLGYLDYLEIIFQDGVRVELDSKNIEKDLEDLSVLLKTIDTQGINAVEIIMNVGDNPIIIQKDD